MPLAMSGPSSSPPTSPSAWPSSCLSSSRRRSRLCKWNRPGSPLVFLLEAALCVALVLAAYSAVRHRRRTSTDVQEVEEGQEDVKFDLSNPFGFTRREARLADRVRDMEDRNAALKRLLSLSQKQLMALAASRDRKRRKPKRITLADDEDEEDEGGEEGGAGAAEGDEDAEKVGGGGAADEEEEEEDTLAEDPCQKGGGADHLPRCETIHVASVVAGVNASRSAVDMLKSLLFYRRHPLHLHLLSDPVAKMVLSRLFATWRVPQLEVSFYSTSAVEDSVSWVPNKHYSGVYGLLKLALPRALPESLEKVIVLDTDLTFAADIALLWKEFRSFGPDAAIGLVENQSDWYIPGKLWKNHRPWPAIGRGFNTGVVLMHIERLRREKWHELWRSTAEKELLTLYSAHLADQDIVNAVLKQRPRLLERLPCQWNLQLSDHTRAEKCYTSSSVRDVGIVHVNSAKKQISRGLKNFEYFRDLLLTFRHYDGNLLRRDLANGCQDETGREEEEEEEEDGEDKADAEQEAEAEEDEGCYQLRRARKTTYRTHLYFLDYDMSDPSSSPDSNPDVTLVAQLSMDRLQTVELLAQRWSGPMSLALYLSDSDAHRLAEFVQGSEVLRSRRDIGYHVVYRELGGGMLYPVNALRNVALDAARTRYVFLSDADFLPGGGGPGMDVHSAIAKAANQLLAPAEEEGERKVALVVPALETHRYRLEQFPRSKAEAVQLMDLGTLSTFRYHVWPRGHRATNYGKWRVATKPYRVRWEQDYEPYVVVSSDVARYDSRFVGFGWNKVSHSMELAASGFDFVVLPSVFAVHMPHSPSLDIARFRASDKYRQCLKDLKTEFVRELNQRYGKSYRI